MKDNNLINVKWFRHGHEDRNDWLRFGFMKLNAKNEITYQEWELKDMLKYGFATEILDCPDLRHKSFILIEYDSIQTKCLVDSEDSFVLFSELLIHVDIYFCAGYNSDVFIHKNLPKFYDWQTENELKWYKNELTIKIDKFSDHFYKVKKFIPIAPNLFKEYPINIIKKRFYNLDDKIRKVIGSPSNYASVYKIYKKRYNALINLRNQPLTYDVTLNDSLWGWPNHRIKLHQALKKLALNGFLINSILKYGEPSIHDNSKTLNLNPNNFPITIGSIDDYEKMLANSKLGVFACGFHWGWRNILTLALFFGIPVTTDRLLTEAYFDIHKFKIYEIEDENWTLVGDLLKDIDLDKWNRIKEHNQKIFDQYLTPEVVAKYLLSQTCK